MSELTPEERASRVCLIYKGRTLLLNAHNREAIAAEIRAAVEAERLRLTSHPAAVCCHEADSTDYPIGLCDSCMEVLHRIKIEPAEQAAAKRTLEKCVEAMICLASMVHKGPTQDCQACKIQRDAMRRACEEGE